MKIFRKIIYGLLSSGLTTATYASCNTEQVTVKVTSEAVTQVEQSPVTGTAPDITPDFDVFYYGEEISANSDDGRGEDVYPGQIVQLQLEAEVSNRDVIVSDVRNGSSESIDGKILARVAGITSWEEVPNSEEDLEFDVKNLVEKDGTSVEVINYVVPDAPPGSELQLQAFVDDDDEIREEGEGNNASRVEKFTIVEVPVWDLRIGKMESDVTKQGDLWMLHYSITNDTDFITPGSIVLEYSSDNTLVRRLSIPPLKAGETRELSISGRSHAVGQETKKVCLAKTQNPFPIMHPGSCGESGILQVDAKPLPPKGSLGGVSCNYITGVVSDPNGTKTLRVHVHDQNGFVGGVDANSNGVFLFDIRNRQNGVAYTYRVYVLDDRVGEDVGKVYIGSVKKTCLPTSVMIVKRATNLTSQSYYFTPDHSSLIGNTEWRREGGVFGAYSVKKWIAGTALIHFNWHNGRRSHVPSTSPTEGVRDGYSRGHATFRCPTRQLPGTRSLWRLYHSEKKSHRAAQDPETIRKSEKSGFKKDRILCYVWPV